MTPPDVSDAAVEVAEFAFCGTTDETMLTPNGSTVFREALRAAIAAAVPELFDLVHQAQWIVEGCWEDITAEQFADLEETEAVTRTLYTLRQEKPE